MEEVCTQTLGGIELRVNEIFYSIQGEGVHVGEPTVFVRLQGCNLRCSFCDTPDAQEMFGGQEVTVDQIIESVVALRSKGWVCITGGNPLCQSTGLDALMYALKYRGYLIEVEENGSYSPPLWRERAHSWCVDVKCPSSGPSYGSFKPEWLRRMKKSDQLKFVVGTMKDLAFVRGLLNGMRLKPTVLVSPSTNMLIDKRESRLEEYWSKEWLQEVAEFCKEIGARYSLQLQKVVWGNKRGV